MRLDRAEMTRRLRFGGLLGIAWFAALLIPESTRLDLIGQDRSWWRMLVWSNDAGRRKSLGRVSASGAKSG